MNRNEKTKAILICTLVVAGILNADRGAKADFVFGELENLGPSVNTSSNEGLARTSSDGLSLYFTSDNPGGFGSGDLYVSTRATINDQWSNPVNLGSYVNTSNMEYWPSISADSLTLYFSSDRPGGHGDADIWQVKRPTRNDEWNLVENLGLPFNTSNHETAPIISADGLELYFASNRSGIWALYVSKRATTYEEWDEPVNLVVLNSAHEKIGAGASLSADGLTLFSLSDRPGGFGDFDIYMATRETKDADWTVPLNLGPQVNTQYTEFCPSISFDGHTLYFCDVPWSEFRPGGMGGGDIWQVSIEPIVDLNSDGIVDAADMCIMVDHWGTDETLCDIGPMPWGDGVVDVEDLIVLAEHLFEEYPPAEPVE
jgi:Tol biopolymer transport system component